MGNSRNVPISLKVVAILFTVGGVFAGINILSSLAQGNISIDIGLLGLFVGPGLLAAKSLWRTCALVLLWFSMLVIPFFAILTFGETGPFELDILGRPVGQVSKEFTLGFAAILFILAVWQYWVLTLPEIRRLFESKND